MTHGTRAANAGFTLIEILVAFTIATMALGLLFRIHGNSTATLVLSRDYQEATVLAQALIEELSVTERSLAFVKTGSTGKYGWSVRAAVYAGTTVDVAETRPPYRLRSITVEVSWAARDRDRRIALNTIKPFFEPEP